MNYRIDNHGMGVFDVDGVPTRRGYTLSSHPTGLPHRAPMVTVDPELHEGEELVRTVDGSIRIITGTTKKVSDIQLFGMSVVVDPVNPDCRFKPQE